MTTVIVLIAVGVVLATVVGFVAVRSAGARRGGVELEPPAQPEVGRRAGASGSTVAPPRPPPEPDDELVAEIEEALAPAETEVLEPEVEAPPRRPTFRERLVRARSAFTGLLGRSRIDEDAWDDLEEALIRADVGVGPASELLDDIRNRVKEEGLESGDQLVDAVKAEMKQRLAVADRSLRFDEGQTNVWVFVGVNGVGKTTSIGKVGKREAADGRRGGDGGR